MTDFTISTLSELYVGNRKTGEVFPVHLRWYHVWQWRRKQLPPHPVVLRHKAVVVMTDHRFSRHRSSLHTIQAGREIHSPSGYFDSPVGYCSALRWPPLSMKS